MEAEREEIKIIQDPLYPPSTRKPLTHFPHPQSPSSPPPFPLTHPLPPQSPYLPPLPLPIPSPSTPFTPPGPIHPPPPRPPNPTPPLPPSPTPPFSPTSRPTHPTPTPPTHAHILLNRLLGRPYPPQERIKTVRNMVESELADSITKVAEERRIADEQMCEVGHLKSYEAEVIQLRGVTHELQKALRASAREMEHLKMREKILEEESTLVRAKRHQEEAEAEFQAEAGEDEERAQCGGEEAGPEKSPGPPPPLPTPLPHKYHALLLIL
ncbi:hypothetical protein C7M84_012700 [Penaeus vannamei]|uniref:Uncharacterized protein n=1 Tax=Penaeus vannamei TaxID=6689 RepID=A0A423SY32_PENVA|nr:hypothetical protein C7M84_012700 [Penaeus vannamei]